MESFHPRKLGWNRPRSTLSPNQNNQKDCVWIAAPAYVLENQIDIVNSSILEQQNCINQRKLLALATGASRATKGKDFPHNKNDCNSNHMIPEDSIHPQDKRVVYTTTYMQVISKASVSNLQGDLQHVCHPKNLIAELHLECLVL